MAAARPTAQITLVPLGEVDATTIEALADVLRARDLEVTVADPLDPPDAAYDAQRDQYRGEMLLGLLRRLEGQHVLGLIDHDLYTATCDFVLGLAELQGRVALVGLRRLREGVAGHRFTERLRKEALHQLAQTLGLDHCPRSQCVMHASQGPAATDQKSSQFCETCWAKLPIPMAPDDP